MLLWWITKGEEGRVEDERDKEESNERGDSDKKKKVIEDDEEEILKEKDSDKNAITRKQEFRRKEKVSKCHFFKPISWLRNWDRSLKTTRKKH